MKQTIFTIAGGLGCLFAGSYLAFAQAPAGQTGPNAQAPANAAAGARQKPPMSFFVTSVGLPGGANMHGLAGADAHCQDLARNATGDRTRVWHAYLSTQERLGQPAVNARDRIGKGPWYNAAGVMIAKNIDDLQAPKATSISRPALTSSARKPRAKRHPGIHATSPGPLCKRTRTRSGTKFSQDHRRIAAPSLLIATTPATAGRATVKEIRPTARGSTPAPAPKSGNPTGSVPGILSGSVAAARMKRSHAAMAPGCSTASRSTDLPASAGRVEERRGGLSRMATLRFLSPLIKPDVPISGIRWYRRPACRRSRNDRSIRRTRTALDLLNVYPQSKLGASQSDLAPARRSGIGTGCGTGGALLRISLRVRGGTCCANAN
jgi:hypothetical protein